MINIQSYSCCFCPECNARNWWYMGHSDRAEGYDGPSGIRCWKCKKEFMPMSREEMVDIGEDPDDVDFTEGKENP